MSLEDLATEQGKTKVELLLKHEQTEGEDYFDLSALFQYLFARKIMFLKVLVFGLAASFIVSIGYLFFSPLSGAVSLICNLSFEGIDRGENPWGGTYNYTEMISAEVLTRALERTGLNNNRDGDSIITVEDVRQNFEIQGIIPKDAMDRILVITEIVQKEPTRLDELLHIDYQPVQYKLTLNIPRRWKISRQQATELIDTVIACYYEWFIETYSDYSFLAVMGEDLVFEDYDYIDQLQIAQNRLSSIKSYLQSKVAVKPDFVSPSRGLKFNDILLQADVLGNVDADSIDSLIYSFSLTKDKEKLLAIYRTRLLNYELSLVGDQQAVTVLERAISEYERPQSTIVVPGFSTSEGSSATYESADFAEYDALTRQKIEANSRVISTQLAIEQLKTRIARLEGDEIVSQEDKEKYIPIVEENMEKLVVNIDRITELTNTVAEEYYRTYEFQDAIRISVGSQFVSKFSPMRIIQIFGIFTGGLLFAVLIGTSAKGWWAISKEQRERVESEKMLKA